MKLNKYVKDKRMERTARNILLFLEKKTDDFQNRVALGIRTAHGWNEFTYKGIGRLSRKIACYLIHNLEVKKGQRMAILSESRPEYGGAVFASVMSGMTTVPLDIKLTKYELISILSDCRPTVLVVSNNYLEMGKELQKEVDSIQHVITLDSTCSCADVMSINDMPQKYQKQ
jgi:long-subunit acyl-CoA synthetase (AMP-forming)